VTAGGFAGQQERLRRALWEQERLRRALWEAAILARLTQQPGPGLAQPR
jgi:hypothetical protein